PRDLLLLSSDEHSKAADERGQKEISARAASASTLQLPEKGTAEACSKAQNIKQTSSSASSRLLPGFPAGVQGVAAQDTKLPGMHLRDISFGEEAESPARHASTACPVDGHNLRGKRSLLLDENYGETPRRLLRGMTSGVHESETRRAQNEFVSNDVQINDA
ncbi:unnamed protein product, partial [Amoebophrya sp. A25]